MVGRKPTSFLAIAISAINKGRRTLQFVASAHSPINDHSYLFNFNIFRQKIWDRDSYKTERWN